jgi:hypothetical protein
MVISLLELFWSLQDLWSEEWDELYNRILWHISRINWKTFYWDSSYYCSINDMKGEKVYGKKGICIDGSL